VKPPAVRPAPRIFQTFCHINEYGEDGFANLHRMIATSEPLVLWGPSSQLLSGPKCRVGGEEFVEYVEQGRIRIVARENWLMSKEARNDPAQNPWAGARWDGPVDGAIRAIACEDQALPDDDDKRVLIAPEARGDHYAAGYLQERPEEISRLSSLLQTADDMEQLPEGLLDSLKRAATSRGATAPSPEALVTRLLRDVFNHGEAIHLASAEAPFFLAPRESTFLSLLDESLRTGVSQPTILGRSPNSSAPRGAEPPAAMLSTDDYAGLTQEVFDILTALDQSRGNSLKGFIAGDGHTALSEWYREVCGQLHQRLPEFRAGTAIRDLQKEHEAGALNTSIEDMVASIDGGSDIVGLVASVADWVSQGTITGFGLAGLAAGLVGAGHGALHGLGYTHVEPGKSEWPFLYTFGHLPTRNQYETVAQALDRLTPSGQ
jgi:hypothetical protein